MYNLYGYNAISLEKECQEKVFFYLKLKSLIICSAWPA